MPHIAFTALLAVVGGFTAALAFTPVVRRLAVRLDNLDHPVGGKIHTLPTPLMGGVAVYLAFALATLLVLPLTPPVIGLLIGGFVAAAVGVVDELLNLRPLVHLAGQFLAAAVTVVSGVGVVHSLSFPLGGLTSPGIPLPIWLGLLFTLVWLVGMMNTINFLDGMDGLATGIATLAALLLAAWAAEPNRFLLAPTPHREDLLLPLALAGALLGFLPYNWRVAKIFLGDSGAMFLGTALGALSIVGPTKLGTALLVLLIPVLDVAWAIVRRQLSGRSFLGGDKQHVYHRLRDLGLGHTRIVLLMYALCAVLGVLDLSLHKTAKFVAFLVLTVLISAGFVLLEMWATRHTLESTSGAAQAKR